MSNQFWALFVITFAHCLVTMAGPARAQWINPSQIRFKLPPGLYVNTNSTQFSLVDTTLSLRAESAIRLPVISMDGPHVLLSTGHISNREIDQLIRLPLKVVVTNSNRHILDATAIQYAGLLDSMYYYDGQDLGGNCSPSHCDIKLWAPTAKSVKVLMATGETFFPERTSLGVWSLTLPGSYKNQFYQYEVQVFQPFTDRLETLITTDPYSKSLSLNSEKSQLIDVDSVEATPPSWDSLSKPVLSSLNDSVIYELHIRDFSANDQSVPVIKRGTYLAFSEKQSTGVRHLKSLAEAGLTHLHLLPMNDFGSVNEDKNSWENYKDSPSDLREAQSVIGTMRTQDPFNWGYDPVHYFTPDGSYAHDANGVSRVREVRTMVQAINSLGLRVISDVVLNHTYQNALSPLSVFDKIVPLYYYRTDDEGRVMNSSCCADTASEHRMMEKLMIENILYWAKTYKIDGFRFDLMSFHSKSTMLRLRQAVRSLTLAKDGVDGSKILLYGEGWSFGSFYDRTPEEAMTLENSAGTEFGFFNDRLRDAVRGGTTNSVEKSDQGFVTGLYFDFNQEPANRNTPTESSGQREKILHLGDVIKVGLAGNLQDFKFREHRGSVISAKDLYFRGAPVGCASQTLETINYVSAHDGYTLWDAIVAKAPFHTPGRSPATASSEDRQRMAQMALAIPLLGQGIPFLEGGTELLRSKNGDQDSYDSGDFFSRIDWAGMTNYWGAGLPPSWKNIDDWSFWTPRLSSADLQIQPDQIAHTTAYVEALLRLRQSSKLFKLTTLAKVEQHLSFIDNANQPEPGLIAMKLQDHNESLLIFLNASREARTFSHESLREPWMLHPLFDEKVDALLAQVLLNQTQRSIQIPGRTTVVLKLSTAPRVTR